MIGLQLVVLSAQYYYEKLHLNYVVKAKFPLVSTVQFRLFCDAVWINLNGIAVDRKSVV